MRKTFKITLTVLVLAVGVYLIWGADSNLTGDVINEGSEEDSGLFRFKEMPITYSINVDSSLGYNTRGNDEYEVQRIKWALDIIQNSTDNLINFQEVLAQDKPQIIINGYPPKEEENNSSFIIEGLAGPTEFNGMYINKSEVNLYPTNLDLFRGENSYYVEGGWLWESTDYSLENFISWEAGDCKEFPYTEIHELLHAFGFDHVYDNSRSVMSPIKHEVQTCKTKEIDREIVSCMNYIYSDGQVEGNCSGINFYPWEEEPKEEDFKWDSLPITYSISDCNDRQRDNLKKAEKVLEEYVGYDLYTFKDIGKGNVNFVCNDNFEDAQLNEETDFWDTTVYFPSAQPYFNFEEEKIKEVEILLFAQERNCGGIEIHELLHGLGLRDHYGQWMKYETEVCDTDNMVIGRDSINKLKEHYGLI